MKLRAFIVFAGLLLVLFSSTSFAALSQFSGSWRNANANTPSITRIQVGVSGTNVTVHAWGKCHPTDCDWGAVRGYGYAATAGQPLPANARAITAVVRTSFSETILVLHSERGRFLRANIYTRFTDNSGRSNYTRSERFVRQGGAAAGGIPGEDCIAFDYRRARVQHINNHWKITVGNMWLKDFGTNRGEAEKALRILRHYRMNKQCFVGRPNPSMEYYLTNNHSPAGAMSGEDCVSFNPGRIQVSRINGRWKIVEGSHWLMDFGNKENEARQSFRILRHYGFTRSCFVGRPNPSMTYFRR